MRYKFEIERADKTHGGNIFREVYALTLQEAIEKMKEETTSCMDLIKFIGCSVY